MQNINFNSKDKKVKSSIRYWRHIIFSIFNLDFKNQRWIIWLVLKVHMQWEKNKLRKQAITACLTQARLHRVFVCHKPCCVREVLTATGAKKTVGVSSSRGKFHHSGRSRLVKLLFLHVYQVVQFHQSVPSAVVKLSTCWIGKLWSKNSFFCAQSVKYLLL